jgi:tRNA 2-thiouridine synthesizing protein A
LVLDHGRVSLQQDEFESNGPRSGAVTHVDTQEVAVAITPDETLDCSGLACPMPILKTKKAIDGLAVGQVLKMIATDPGSESDMNAWTARTGHELVEHEVSGGTYTFYIRKVG